MGCESIIQFPERQQTSIGSDVGTVELQLETPVEIEPKSVRFRFTRWVRHDRPRSDDIRCWNLYLNRRERGAVQWFIRGMQVLIKFKTLSHNVLQICKALDFELEMVRLEETVSGRLN